MFYLTSMFHDNRVNTFGFMGGGGGLLKPSQAQELQKRPGGIRLKLLIDNSGNSLYNDIKFNWYERLVKPCHIKLYSITLIVKIMRIIQKEHTQHFTTVLPSFCLLAVKIAPIIPPGLLPPSLLLNGILTVSLFCNCF